jgi:hypothetical protein
MADMNKQKVVGELFQVLVKINDMMEGFQFTRLSPTTKEVIQMLHELVRAAQHEARTGGAVAFELRVWRQASLWGDAIDTDGGAE